MTAIESPITTHRLVDVSFLIGNGNEGTGDAEDLCLVGMNCHRVRGFRESFSVDPAGTVTLRRQLQQITGARELVLLATCHRLEVILAGVPSPFDPDQIFQTFAHGRALNADVGLRGGFVLRDEAVIRHLIRVVCGLDSPVLGEPQIVHQVKRAYTEANRQGCVGSQLHRLVQRSLAFSKRLRSEFGLTSSRNSIPAAAAGFARRLFNVTSGPEIVLVGAGQMIRALCHELRRLGLHRLVIANRSADRARQLAERQGVRWAPLPIPEDTLSRADMIICSTAAPNIVLSADQLRHVQDRRHHRALPILDLAAPPDVEVAAAQILGVRLFDIHHVCQRRDRTGAVDERTRARCDQLIEEEMCRYRRQSAGERHRTLIAQAYRDAQRVAEHELRRLYPADASMDSKQYRAIEHMMHRLANKLMHPYTKVLRDPRSLGTATVLTDTLHEVSERCVPPASPGSARTSAATQKADM